MGKIDTGLGALDLYDLLGVHVLSTFNSGIPFLHELALNLNSGIGEPLKFMFMSASGSSKIIDSPLNFGLNLSFGSGQALVVLFGAAELTIFLTELGLQFGDCLLNSL